MLTLDIMTKNGVTVGLDMLVDAASRLLAANHITAVPLFDAQKRVMGIIGDSDLMHRMAGWPAPHESLLHMIVETRSGFAKRARKIFGQLVRDVMTQQVVMVDPHTPIPEIAELLADRTNLVQAWASTGSAAFKPSQRDGDIRRQMLSGIRDRQGSLDNLVNAIVCHGVVHLWSMVDTAEQSEAKRVVADAVHGVKGVRHHVAAPDRVPSDIAAVV